MGWTCIYTYRHHLVSKQHYFWTKVIYIHNQVGGDASTRYLASFQDPSEASLKDAFTLTMPLAIGTSKPASAVRGRENYLNYGTLRTKPGRADSPTTSCMSCSDKIAAWAVVGFQGALLANLMRRVFLHHIILGEVDEHMHQQVKEDCNRAFRARLKVADGAS